MEAFSILFKGFVGFLTFKLTNYGISGSSNENSPVKFDIKYWLSDRHNWNDGLLGLIVFGIIAVYKDSIFTIFASNFLVSNLLPYKDSDFLYIAIGFLMTLIIMLIRVLWNFLYKKVNLLINKDN